MGNMMRDSQICTYTISEDGVTISMHCHAILREEILSKVEEIRARELHHLEFLKRYKRKGADVKPFINESKKQIKFIDLRITQYKEYIFNNQENK